MHQSNENKQATRFQNKDSELIKHDQAKLEKVIKKQYKIKNNKLI